MSGMRGRRGGLPLPRWRGATPICALLLCLSSSCSSTGSKASDASFADADASAPACNPPHQMCSGGCANVSTDPQNCGHCNNPCTSGMFCSAGSCVHACPSGQMSCGSSCVDITTDHENCGMCNKPCNADRQCMGGDCHCPAFTSDCNGTCTNTDQDTKNCGLCNRACKSDEICNKGSCVCAGGTRETRCNDGIDNNCNGLIDCADPDCVGATRPCMGTCGQGAEICGMNGQWSTCMGGNGAADVCGSGIDSDCDGKTLRNPDMFQPNNTCNQAWQVPGMNPNMEFMPRFDTVEVNEEYFKFDAVDNILLYPLHIRITVDQIPMGHNYDLYLYKSMADCLSDTPLAQSTNPSNMPEMIDWVEDFFGSDTGTYYVRVVRITGYSCTMNYHLVVNGLNN